MVLWNLVLDGTNYLSQIESYEKDFKSSSFTRNKINESGSVESLGFIFNKSLVKEIKSVCLDNLRLKNVKKTLLITEVKNFNLLHNDKSISFIENTNKNFWLKKDGDNEKAQVAIEEIHQIVKWLNQNV